MELHEKRLSPRERSEPEAVSRLEAEAELLARLDRAGVRVVPRLVASGADARGPWIRTERLPFPTLAEQIERSGPLAAAVVERAAAAAYAALAALHGAADEAGPLAIVHADLTPANIALAPDGSRAILLDFDLAWWREAPPRDDGAFRGTIGYVAPEVARGERPTARSDLFSLAASLHHAATGSAAPERSRADASFAALLFAAAETPLLDARGGARFAEGGPGHAAIVACLAHDPARRPASAEAAIALMAAARLC